MNLKQGFSIILVALLAGLDISICLCVVLDLAFTNALSPSINGNSLIVYIFLLFSLISIIIIAIYIQKTKIEGKKLIQYATPLAVLFVLLLTLAVALFSLGTF